MLLRFVTDRRCNVFGFGRCAAVLNVAPTVRLFKTIVNGLNAESVLLSFMILIFFPGLPFVGVKALVDLPAETELTFDWGDEKLKLSQFYSSLFFSNSFCNKDLFKVCFDFARLAVVGVVFARTEAASSSRKVRSCLCCFVFFWFSWFSSKKCSASSFSRG